MEEKDDTYDLLEGMYPRPTATEKFFQQFFSLFTQMLIAAFAVSLGLLLMGLWPVDVPTWVFQSLMGLAIVGPACAILTLPWVIYSDYKSWKDNDGSKTYLEHQQSAFVPTTLSGKIFTVTGLIFFSILLGGSICLFLGDPFWVQHLSPLFNTMSAFLHHGLSPLTDFIGLPTLMITPKVANVTCALFFSALPLVILELGRKARLTISLVGEEQSVQDEQDIGVRSENVADTFGKSSKELDEDPSEYHRSVWSGKVIEEAAMVTENAESSSGNSVIPQSISNKGCGCWGWLTAE